MKIAFTGRPSLGGVQMRGMSIAKELGIPFIPIGKIKPSDRFDTLILVKYWTDPLLIRRVCDRLIYDPLDPWSSWKLYDREKPKRFWKWVYRHLRPDDILATSPACQKTMEDAKCDMRVHLVPHHADPRVRSGWRNPAGPIVYAGGERFIRNRLPDIVNACEKLGRQFLMNTTNDGWKALEGAALSLNLRLPPHDLMLNRYCKPQIKSENAAAAGVPMLATDDPCVTSLRDVVTWSPNDNLADRMHEAMESGSLSSPETLTSSADRIREIVEV